MYKAKYKQGVQCNWDEYEKFQCYEKNNGNLINSLEIRLEKASLQMSRHQLGEGQDKG